MSSNKSSKRTPAKRRCVRPEGKDAPLPAVNGGEPILLRDVLRDVCFFAYPEDPQVRFVCREWHAHLTVQLSRPEVLAKLDPLTRWEESIRTFVDIRGRYVPDICPGCGRSIFPFDAFQAWEAKYGWPGPPPNGAILPPVDSARSLKILRHVSARNLPYLLAMPRLCQTLSTSEMRAGDFCRCGCGRLDVPRSMPRLVDYTNCRELNGTLICPAKKKGDQLKVHFRTKYNNGDHTFVVDYQTELVRPTMNSSSSSLMWDPVRYDNCNLIKGSNGFIPSHLILADDMAQVVATRKANNLREYVAAYILVKDVCSHRRCTRYNDKSCPVRNFLNSKLALANFAKFVGRFELGPLEITNHTYYSI